jgi:hypothetical protein
MFRTTVLPGAEDGKHRSTYLFFTTALKPSTVNTLSFALFMTGMSLTIWSVEIYYQTFIPSNLLLGIGTGTGLLVTPFLRKTLATGSETRSLLAQLMLNLSGWGGIAVFLVLWTNRTFTDDAPRTMLFKVTEAGYLAAGRSGCGKGYVLITHQGQSKQLVFGCGSDVKAYRYVQAEVKKGLWGYEYITDQYLTNE